MLYMFNTLIQMNQGRFGFQSNCHTFRRYLEEDGVGEMEKKKKKRGEE